MDLVKVAEFKCCLTCVFRKPQPSATRIGRSRFYCSRAGVTGRTLVKPEESCDFWEGVYLDNK